MFTVEPAVKQEKICGETSLSNHEQADASNGHSSAFHSPAPLVSSSLSPEQIRLGVDQGGYPELQQLAWEPNRK